MRGLKELGLEFGYLFSSDRVLSREAASRSVKDLFWLLRSRFRSLRVIGQRGRQLEQQRGVAPAPCAGTAYQ